jgi:hypothetical protein
MTVGALIAALFFTLGYLACEKMNYQELEDIPIEYPEKIETTQNTTDTTDIYRIKDGPKKGLLSYKKVKTG